MRTLASLSAVAAFAAFSVVASATTFTDGFNSATNVALSQTTVGNFHTYAGRNIDVLGTADGLANLCTPGDGSINCVDLGGTGGNFEGFLRSNTVFTAGTYDLSFFLTGSLRGNQADTEVTLGNYDVTFFLASGDITSGHIVNAVVTVTTPSSLNFLLLNNTDQGDILNSVRVVRVDSPSSVPEPSSLVLLGSGMLTGLGLLKRRMP